MTTAYQTTENCASCGGYVDLYVDPESVRRAWKECLGCGNIPEALVIEKAGEELGLDSFTATYGCNECGANSGERHKPRCGNRFALMHESGLKEQPTTEPNDSLIARQKARAYATPPQQERDEMQNDQNDNPKNPTVNMVGEAVAHAGKVAVASEAGDALLEIAHAALGDRYPDLFETDEGKQIAKMTVAIMLHYGTDAYPGAFPAPDAIGKACQYVVEGSARDLIQPRLSALRPKLDKLATVGQKLKQIESKESTEAKPNGASTFVPAGQVPTED